MDKKDTQLLRNILRRNHIVGTRIGKGKQENYTKQHQEKERTQEDHEKRGQIKPELRRKGGR